MNRIFLKMWADPSTAVCCMLSSFLVITPIRAGYFVGKDPALRATSYYRSHSSFFILHSKYFQCKILVFRKPFSLFVRDTKIPGIATSMRNFSWFFLLMCTISGCLAFITRSNLSQMLKSYKIFVSWFSITPSVLCLYQCLTDSNRTCYIAPSEP